MVGLGECGFMRVVQARVRVRWEVDHPTTVARNTVLCCGLLRYHGVTTVRLRYCLAKGTSRARLLERCRGRSRSWGFAPRVLRALHTCVPAGS